MTFLTKSDRVGQNLLLTYLIMEEYKIIERDLRNVGRTILVIAIVVLFATSLHDARNVPLALQIGEIVAAPVGIIALASLGVSWMYDSKKDVQLPFLDYNVPLLILACTAFSSVLLCSYKPILEIVCTYISLIVTITEIVLILLYYYKESVKKRAGK